MNKLFNNWLSRVLFQQRSIRPFYCQFYFPVHILPFKFFLQQGVKIALDS